MLWYCGYLAPVIFNLLPVPIKPTIIHILLFILCILYGPQVGMVLVSYRMSVEFTNTIVLIPSSYLLALYCTKRKSTFAYDRYGAPHFNRSHSLSVYSLHQQTWFSYGWSSWFLLLAIFVLGGVFFLFSNVYQEYQAMLAVVYPQIQLQSYLFR